MVKNGFEEVNIENWRMLEVESGEARTRRSPQERSDPLSIL
jgi:hypothetical protein